MALSKPLPVKTEETSEDSSKTYFSKIDPNTVLCKYREFPGKFVKYTYDLATGTTSFDPDNPASWLEEGRFKIDDKKDRRLFVDTPTLMTGFAALNAAETRWGLVIGEWSENKNKFKRATSEQQPIQQNGAEGKIVLYGNAMYAFPNSAGKIIDYPTILKEKENGRKFIRWLLDLQRTTLESAWYNPEGAMAFKMAARHKAILHKAGTMDDIKAKYNFASDTKQILADMDGRMKKNKAMRTEIEESAKRFFILNASSMVYIQKEGRLDTKPRVENERYDWNDFYYIEDETEEKVHYTEMMFRAGTPRYWTATFKHKFYAYAKADVAPGPLAIKPNAHGVANMYQGQGGEIEPTANGETSAQATIHDAGIGGSGGGTGYKPVRVNNNLGVLEVPGYDFMPIKSSVRTPIKQKDGSIKFEYIETTHHPVTREPLGKGLGELKEIARALVTPTDKRSGPIVSGDLVDMRINLCVSIRKNAYGLIGTIFSVRRSASGQGEAIAEERFSEQVNELNQLDIEDCNETVFTPQSTREALEIEATDRAEAEFNKRRRLIDPLHGTDTD